LLGDDPRHGRDNSRLNNYRQEVFDACEPEQLTGAERVVVVETSFEDVEDVWSAGSSATGGARSRWFSPWLRTVDPFSRQSGYAQHLYRAYGDFAGSLFAFNELSLLPGRADCFVPIEQQL
jgi:hypothetical protein